VRLWHARTLYLLYSSLQVGYSLPDVTNFFLIFSILSSALLVAAAGLGYFHAYVGLSDGHHLLLGLGAATLAISLHCLIFGIFTGAGKDTRELVEDLSLDPEFTKRTKAFRKIVFPPALYSIMLLMISAILGGAAGNSTALRWTHGLAMWFTIFYNIKSFILEYRAVRDNARILKTVNQVAMGAAAPVVEDSEVALLSSATTKLEWGTHVYALGKFLCFLGWNMWLPYIYLRFIVGYFSMPVWPYLLTWSVLVGGGYYLRARYQSYRPQTHHPVEKASLR
jgi:hypothetical protein